MQFYLLFILCDLPQQPPADNNWQPTITILACLASGAIAFYIATFNNKKSEKKALDDQLDSLLKIAVQYPYLEMSTFTEAWKPEKISSVDKDEAEQYQRYDIYTTMLFNYLQRYCEFHEYTPNKLKIVDIQSWIKSHQQIWNNPTHHMENVNAYPEKFRCLLDNYIKA